MAIDLDKLETLLAAGTSGGDCHYDHGPGGSHRYRILGDDNVIGGVHAESDAKLFVALRSAAPELIAGVRRLRIVTDDTLGLDPFIGRREYSRMKTECRRLQQENELLTDLCDTADDAIHDLAKLAGITVDGAVYGEMIGELPEIVRRLQGAVRTGK